MFRFSSVKTGFGHIEHGIAQIVDPVELMDSSEQGTKGFRGDTPHPPGASCERPSVPCSGFVHLFPVKKSQTVDGKRAHGARHPTRPKAQKRAIPSACPQGLPSTLSDIVSLRNRTSRAHGANIDFR